MPINILSLPDKDIQYALNCMDIEDLIAFSLCSKRTKILAKSSNRNITPPSVVVFGNCICFKRKTREFQEFQDDSDHEYSDLEDNVNNDPDTEFIDLDLFDSFVKI
ncbi:unnamed protein product [Caenorhabditis nigoni]